MTPGQRRMLPLFAIPIMFYGALAIYNPGILFGALPFIFYTLFVSKLAWDKVGDIDRGK